MYDVSLAVYYSCGLISKEMKEFLEEVPCKSGVKPFLSVDHIALKDDPEGTL